MAAECSAGGGAGGEGGGRQRHRYEWVEGHRCDGWAQDGNELRRRGKSVERRRIWAQLPGLYGRAGTEGGRHGPGEAEEDEAGRGGVLRGGQEWRARGKEAECAAG